MRLPGTAATMAIALLAAPPITAQEGSFDSNGVPIHYLQAGQGETVILIHGNGGSIEDWTETGIFQNLAAGFHVIALDCRGFGKSGRPHDPKDYGKEMML
jgi:pimeloyl-ACP methyl ester carboxylesterase